MSDDATLRSGRSLEDGQAFGAYRILRLLGVGGMGEVYEAVQAETGRRVALKVMSHRLDSETDRKRFLREGRLAASVSHPNVVYIFGSEEIDDRPVIAMEYVTQGTLRDRVRESGPWPVTEAVDTILQIINGLETAASIGVLHRDVKPSNCFLDSEGVAKIGDFGLSISTQARPESALTITGSVLGTPSFASPEQLRGDPLDVGSDIYSVGATLYYLLTGERPFEGKELIHLISRVLQEEPRAPHELRPGIPRRLSRVVLRCLAKAPAARYPDYDSLRRALEPYRSQTAATATLGRRLAAYVVDGLALVPLELVPGLADAVDNVLLRTGEAWARFAVVTIFTILYFAVAEGLWKTTIGKAVLGLRVIRGDGRAPGLARGLARSVLVNGSPYASALVLLLFVSAPEFAANPDGWGWVTFWAYFFPLAYFVPALRGNGYPLHDRVTGTRVVCHATPERRASAAGWVEQARATGAAANAAAMGDEEASEGDRERVGQYLVQTRLAGVSGESLLLGRDPALGRDVVIAERLAVDPALDRERRDLTRPARVRWLAGGRSDDSAWDAFELPDGFPLLQAERAAVPWTVVRGWLRDLTTELAAGIAQPASAALAGADRLWVTRSGRILLLDWRAPGLDRDVADPVVAVRDVDSLQAFLVNVANIAADRSSGSGVRRAKPVEMSMRDAGFMVALAERRFRSAEEILATLRDLAGRRVRVSPSQRVTSAVVPLAFFALLAATGLVAYRSERPAWERSHPGLPSLHHVVDYRARAAAEPAEQAVIEALVATRYRSLLAESTFWTDPSLHAHIASARPWIERALAERAAPTPAELAAVDDVLDGVLRAYAARRGEVEVVVILGIVAGLCLAVVVLFSIVGVVVTGRMVGLSLLGIGVVDRRGRPASRLRLASRILLGLALAGAGIYGAVQAGLWLSGQVARAVRQPGPGIVGALPALLQRSPAALPAVLLVLLIVIWYWRSPGRAPHDWLAGTRLVPE